MALMILGYVAFAAFVVAVLVRVVHFANTPVHLRWELYPVPHEPPEKASHGGSYLEDVDWWLKPHKADHVHELYDMFSEMLLIKALWHHNRKLWFVSFPFHAGLYALMGCVGLLLLGGLLGALGVDVSTGGGLVGMALTALTALTGFAGFGLGLLGACGLLMRRLTDADLKDFTGPIDYLNLVLFIVLFAAGGAAMALDPLATDLSAYFQGVFSLQPATDLSPVTMVAIVLACLMVIYIPLTHMSHFVAKYFTWHSVRWNDEALQPGSRLDKTLQEQLAYKLTWAAPHIDGKGEKTWAEVATTNPFQEEKGK